MIYSVRHTTTYTYEDGARFAQCVLRLRPRDTARQTVLSSQVEISPEPAQALRQLGPFGEEVVRVLIDQPHHQLVISARSRVLLAPEPGMGLFASPRLADVRDQASRSEDLGPDGPATFLYPTSSTPLVKAITAYARESFADQRPIYDAAHELMSRIHGDFAYDVTATDVATPAAVAFAHRRGVCQDFANVMVSGLRGLGVPAAYVSGYLRTEPPPGEARLQGADATHAWVRVWCGIDLGWVGFDPTNAVVPNSDHIVLAVGRDYADVAPIEGVILTEGRQSLKVEVDVTPEV